MEVLRILRPHDNMTTSSGALSIGEMTLGYFFNYDDNTYSHIDMGNFSGIIGSCPKGTTLSGVVRCYFLCTWYKLKRNCFKTAAIVLIFLYLSTNYCGFISCLLALVSPQASIDKTNTPPPPKKKSVCVMSWYLIFEKGLKLNLFMPYLYL